MGIAFLSFLCVFLPKIYNAQNHENAMCEMCHWSFVSDFVEIVFVSDGICNEIDSTQIY